MDFTFSKNKTIFKRNLYDFKVKDNGKIKFTELDLLNPINNIITINNIDYYFKYLNNKVKTKGGNSIILELYISQNIDTNDINYDKPDFILKILKHKKSENSSVPYVSEKRFEKEIEALTKSSQNNSQNIIEIYDSGTCKIWSAYCDKYEDYLFYTMEYADYDLKSFIEENHSRIGLEGKLDLCISIASGIGELKGNGYYHRDIKPDNIFIIDNKWKIGDLGLVAERENNLDSNAEFIGPRGWISPEVMNKYLSENKNFEINYDCIIDHQSDIFQLGKVFWYIFQHNAPIGAIKMSDFKIKNNRIYPILKTMLNHSKKKRFRDIGEVIKLLKPIQSELLKVPII